MLRLGVSVRPMKVARVCFTSRVIEPSLFHRYAARKLHYGIHGTMGIVVVVSMIENIFQEKPLHQLSTQLTLADGSSNPEQPTSAATIGLW